MLSINKTVSHKMNNLYRGLGELNAVKEICGNPILTKTFSNKKGEIYNMSRFSDGVDKTFTFYEKDGKIIFESMEKDISTGVRKIIKRATNFLTNKCSLKEIEFDATNRNKIAKITNTVGEIDSPKATTSVIKVAKNNYGGFLHVYKTSGAMHCNFSV